MQDFRFDEAALIGAWLAAALWGLFSALFAYALLTTFSSLTPAKLRAIIPLSLIYILATIHVSMNLHRMIDVFILDPKGLGSPSLNLSDVTQHRVKDMFYVTVLWMSDSLIAWRCYMVWQQNKIILLISIVMVLGTAISSYGALGQYFLIAPDLVTAVHWGNSMFSVSMATNIIFTLLTAGRIWWLSRSISRDLPSGSTVTGRSVRYNRVILIVVESGAFVTIAKITEFVLFNLSPPDGLSGMNGYFVILEAMPQILGIAPSLIIITVNTLAVSEKYYATSQPSAYRSNANTGTSGTAGSHIQFHKWSTGRGDSTMQTGRTLDSEGEILSVGMQDMGSKAQHL